MARTQSFWLTLFAVAFATSVEGAKQVWQGVTDNTSVPINLTQSVETE